MRVCVCVGERDSLKTENPRTEKPEINVKHEFYHQKTGIHIQVTLYTSILTLEKLLGFSDYTL